MHSGPSHAKSPRGVADLLTNAAVLNDNESRLAATLRRTHGAEHAPAGASHRDGSLASPKRTAPPPARDAIVVEIIRAIEDRLPGRIRELRVERDQDHYALHGVSSSYYVKQLAGHLAMTALESRVLGRLSNEIAVRSVR